MAKLYYATSEGAGILNPGERGFRSLDKALALAAKEAEECSWACLTPPAPDNEVATGKGNFRCGVMAPHGIQVRVYEDGRLLETEGYDVPEEDFRRAKRTSRADWTLEIVVDRGTGYAADGHDVLYFTGAEQTDTGWDSVVEAIADGDEVLEATVRPTPHGRYHHLTGGQDGYPMRWEKGRGF